MHLFPCGQVMGCPIAMCRNNVRMITPLVIVARAPQSSCNGDFVIDCGGRAARLASYTGPYLASRYTPVHSHTYQCRIGSALHVACKCPSQLVGATYPKTDNIGIGTGIGITYRLGSGQESVIPIMLLMETII